MRSISLALGICSLILGVQSLFVDHVVFSNNRVPQFVQNLADSNGPNVNQVGGAARNYDPNYFNGPFSNGAAQIGQGQLPVQNAVYGSNGYDPRRVNPAAPLGGNLRARVGPKRIMQTKDWMPWTLFAAGTVLVLLSKRRGSFGGDD